MMMKKKKKKHTHTHTGFLKTSSKGSAQGNYGLMDLVAGVHWLRENLPAFGGDSNRLTLLGHGTGAALANFLAVSPMAKGQYMKKKEENVCVVIITREQLWAFMGRAS